MKEPIKVRICESVAGWIIQEAGEEIPAPFPLTDEQPGTPEYEAAAELQIERFCERINGRRGFLPRALMERARELARAAGCLEIVPYFSDKLES